MEAYKIVIFAIAGIYMVRNFKHAIQMLQQNSYRIDRYWRYQRDHLAAVHMQGDVVQDRLAADMDGQMLDFQAAGVFAVARVRVQMWNHESASRIVSMFL